jgi:hypothetical protein
VTLHFVDQLPVLGYREVDGRDLAFAWAWHTPCLRVTFTKGDPHLLGQVVALDDRPRLIAAPDNLDWLQAADDRRLGILEHAADLWDRKEHLFHICDG